MTEYIFSNLIGSFVFDDKLKLVDKILFKNLEEYKNKDKFEEKLKNKHKDAKAAEENQLKKYCYFLKITDISMSFIRKTYY